MACQKFGNRLVGTCSNHWSPFFQNVDVLQFWIPYNHKGIDSHPARARGLHSSCGRRSDVKSGILPMKFFRQYLGMEDMGVSEHVVYQYTIYNHIYP